MLFAILFVSEVEKRTNKGGLISPLFVSGVRFEGNRGLPKPTEQPPLEVRYE